MSNEWEAIHQSRHWGTYPAEYMVRLVKQFMAGRSDTPSALDIGCGAGAHSWMMEREGMSVSAIDISPTAIARMPQIAPSALAFVGDITVAEWSPMSFDFVLDNLSLTHVERPPMERILSWLKPGGVFVSASFLIPPHGAPRSWPHAIGELLETHEISRSGHSHKIGVHKWSK